MLKKRRNNLIYKSGYFNRYVICLPAVFIFKKSFPYLAIKGCLHKVWKTRGLIGVKDQIKSSVFIRGSICWNVKSGRRTRTTLGERTHLPRTHHAQGLSETDKYGAEISWRTGRVEIDRQTKKSRKRGSNTWLEIIVNKRDQKRMTMII